MAALNALSGFVAFVMRFSARVDSEARAVYPTDQATQININTGNGSSTTNADIMWVDRIALTSGLSATALDVRNLAQCGNTQVLVSPNYLVVRHVSGDGQAAFVQGAANPYLGIGLVPFKVDKYHPIAVIPLHVDTTATTAINIDYSETGSAAVTVDVTIWGSST